VTGRLASRAADAEALLARFNEASEAALSALGRRDRDALGHALDVREALQHEIERALRDITAIRSRFAPDGTTPVGGTRVMDRAVEQYCAPLEELARAGQVLQERLESSANQIRDGILGEIASIDGAASIAASYSPAVGPDVRRLDVVL
jgi:hypothetical protein